MVLQINLGFLALILVLVAVIAVRYSLIRKARGKLRQRHDEVLQEQELFLSNFNAAPFDDFSAFEFKLGHFSHVSPFPTQVEGEWRYVINLTRSEVDDFVTVNHEICECTIGRIVERLLSLEKPLYLQRKENNRFWVHGKKQRYLVEHMLATLGEIDELTPEKLKERLDKEETEELTST